ncbi:DUF2927 domain-containing protein [Neptuniibacter sp. CAU 1671]|uniref:DUF2927 domain-containing protein n=1 Tax=Neptuniibacter sp. CAU 1671 TaxID=3032593 RepID=UPI0023D9E240|nr:DUF2927 domain-containing protein [Neptuniibacter sp. CAU 1671]MDF2181632.1 DUF2927 domain-containing protein [Neptuniibacter sp. CAU 1671]
MLKRSCLCLLMLCCAQVSAAEELSWQSPAFIQQAFIAVALRNEYQAGAKPLRRWRQDVRVWLDHRVPDQTLHQALVEDHLRHLAAITGHPIHRVNNKADANVQLVFTRQETWAREAQELMGSEVDAALHGAVCLAGFDVNAGEIIRARVIIPVDQARMHGRLVACIVEELTQIMGLPNDSEAAYPSIFNDKSPEQILSPLDVVLLRLLYQPQLRPGMQEPEVRRVTEKILNRWREDGTIASAVGEARSGELYQRLAP